jgi:hypothetical protein
MAGTVIEETSGRVLRDFSDGGYPMKRSGAADD